MSARPEQLTLEFQMPVGGLISPATAERCRRALERLRLALREAAEPAP